MGFSSWRESQNPHFWNPPSTSFEDMYITHHTNFLCKWKQNILEALTPCSSFHFLDLRFRFTFDFAWLSPFTVVHWLLCAWFTFTFQLYHRSFKVYIHFSIKFTFPLLLNSLSLFSLIYFAEKDAAHKWTFMDSFWWALQFLVRKHKYNFNWKYSDHEINWFFYQNCTRSTREEDWFMIFVTRWGLMVLTTVGYGEKVPHTWAGQVIHTLAARQLSCAFFCIPGGYHE